MNLCGRLALALPLAVGAVAAQAADGTQPLDSLQHAAEAFVRAHVAPAGGRVVVRAATLDPRLRLAACTAPLQAELPGDRIAGTRASVAVHCPGPSAWRLFVPVEVHVYREVLVGTRALARGETVAAADVRAEERDVAQLGYGYLTDPAALAGRQLLRPLRAGAVLSPVALAAPTLVRRGDQVTLLAGAGALAVRSSGTALENGSEGAQVRVRNAGSGRIVQGVVQAAGTVAALP